MPQARAGPGSPLLGICACVLLAVSGIALAQTLTQVPLDKPAFPTALAVSPDGKIWFADLPNGQVGNFTPDGHVTGPFPLPPVGSDSVKPLSIVWGDTAAFFTYSVQRTGGATVGCGIGRVTGAGAISLFPSSDATGCDGISPITKGSDGNLYAGFFLSGNILKMTPSGTQTLIPLPFGSNPSGITRGPDGNVWCTTGSGVARVTPSGAVATFPISGSLAQEITSGPDGLLYVSDAANNTLDSVNPTSGAVAKYSMPTSGSFPLGIASSGGKILITEFNANKIAIFDPVSKAFSEVPTPGSTQPKEIVGFPGTFSSASAPHALGPRAANADPDGFYTTNDGPVGAVRLSAPCAHPFRIVGPENLVGRVGNPFFAFEQRYALYQADPFTEGVSFTLSANAPEGAEIDFTGRLLYGPVAEGDYHFQIVARAPVGCEASLNVHLEVLGPRHPGYLLEEILFYSAGPARN